MCDLTRSTHLIEVPNSGNVVLSGLPHDLPRVGDDHGGVGKDALVRCIPLQDRAQNHHVVSFSHLCVWCVCVCVSGVVELVGYYCSS